MSSVEGSLVTRFGTRSRREYIGAVRSIERPTEITWNTSQVVPIPLDEYMRFKRAYDRALADGSLKRRTKADYLDSLTPPPQEGGA